MYNPHTLRFRFVCIALLIHLNVNRKSFYIVQKDTLEFKSASWNCVLMFVPPYNILLVCTGKNALFTQFIHTGRSYPICQLVFLICERNKHTHSCGILSHCLRFIRNVHCKTPQNTYRPGHVEKSFHEKQKKSKILSSSPKRFQKYRPRQLFKKMKSTQKSHRMGLISWGISDE